MTRIILADNQGVFRAGLARILSQQPDYAIIAQCRNKEELQCAIAGHRKFLLIFTSTLMADVEEIVRVVIGKESRAIVILESNENAGPFKRAYLHGIITRSITTKTLVECVAAVERGERVMQLAYYQNGVDEVGIRARDRLTAKEKNVVALLIGGAKNKEIAFQLHTTEQVIKNYLRGVYDKVGVSDRLELTVFTLAHPAMHDAVLASVEVAK